MKKVKIIFITIIMVLSLENVEAKRGCCSWHGGVSGCSSGGIVICNDGTYSPSCTCTPPKVYGCTDSSALNYNSNANTDNGGCRYERIEYEKIIIEYDVEIRNPNNIEVGKETIIQEGKNGVKEVQYTIIVDSKGNQISKEKGIELMIEEPINQIILVEELTQEIQELETYIKQETVDEETENNIYDAIIGMTAIGGIIFYYKKYKKKKKNKTLML